MTEPDSLVGEEVEERARRPHIAIRAQMMRAQRVDQDEQHVGVGALLQRDDVVGGADRTRIDQTRLLFLPAEQCDRRDEDRCQHPRPRPEPEFARRRAHGDGI
jgi:hypothetical protein